MKVQWQYRTILFEFQKDGLLGDKYIDDDEMEQVLNDYGGKGWELVSVTPVQEGLLSFFKRDMPQARSQGVIKSAGPSKLSAKNMSRPGKPILNKQIPGEEKSVTPSNEKPEKPKQQSDGIGEIKIS